MDKFLRISSSDNQNTRCAKKSFKKNLKTKLKRVKRIKTKQLNAVRHSNFSVSNKFAVFSSEITHFIESNKNILYNTNSFEVVLDDDFSLYENPQKVIFSLLNILNEAKKNSEFISLKYKNKLSFGALYFIDTICWEIAKSKRWELRSNLPERERNLLKNLKSIYSNTSESVFEYIINSKIKINRTHNALAKQIHKEKSKEIRDLVIKGMKDEDSEYIDLSHNEHEAIDSAISEHFDNILLHVPDAEYGFLCGYYDKVRSEITILIYNFGHTIAMTLDRKGLPEHIQVAVNKVVENHKNNYFLFGSSFSRENALTLLAIQEGISSKLDADVSRGHGLIDFITHCKGLNKETRIVIISGKTAIKIDSDYEISERLVFDRKRKILAFNKNNDIFDKPNPDKVVNLSSNFPGVIIETTIPLKIKTKNEASN